MFKKSTRRLIGKYEQLTITMVSVQAQRDGYNCGLFAVAFEDILQGMPPSESCFDITRMREHLIEYLEKERLSVFPKQAPVAVDKTKVARFLIFELYIIWQGEKAHIVSKKCIFYVNCPSFSHTSWLKSE